MTTLIRDRWQALDALMECAGSGYPVAQRSGMPLHVCCEELAVKGGDVRDITQHEREVIAAGSDTEVTGTVRYYLLTLRCPLCEETYQLELRPKEDRDGATWWEWERLHGVRA